VLKGDQTFGSSAISVYKYPVFVLGHISGIMYVYNKSGVVKVFVAIYVVRTVPK